MLDNITTGDSPTQRLLACVRGVPYNQLLPGFISLYTFCLSTLMRPDVLPIGNRGE